MVAMANLTPADQPRLRAGDADRDAVLEVLQEAHASGRLTISDVTERQGRALEAVFTDELPGLVADLPEGRQLAARMPGSVVPPRAAGTEVSSDNTMWTMTVMSGRTFDLEPGRGLRNFALMGGDEIYLTDALGPGVRLVVEVPAVMGGHNFYVPEGVRVIEETQGVMGGNSIKRGAQGDGSNGTLVLRGVLLMGGHNVKLDKRAR